MQQPFFTNSHITLHHAESLELLKTLPENSIDACVTDPPYELGFMGKTWDATGIAYNVALWREVLRVLKPGGHLLSFGGSRTYHRMAVAIEDAGFEIRDQIMWVYGSGFPKSLDVSKAIDKAAGVERDVLQTIARPNSFDDYGEGGGGYKAQCVKITAPATEASKEWNGWGTALKPAHEPICVARKPLVGTVAENVQQHRTGALNIDGCRVGNEERTYGGMSSKQPEVGTFRDDNWKPKEISVTVNGRWPANFIHDGSEEVLELFPVTTSGSIKAGQPAGRDMRAGNVDHNRIGGRPNQSRDVQGSTGSAARFFYCAKAAKSERGEGNTHPTVKPLALMRYLCRLVTPPGGTVLDPFGGSGTTALAAQSENLHAILIEKEEPHCQIIHNRLTEKTELTK